MWLEGSKGGERERERERKRVYKHAPWLCRVCVWLGPEEVGWCVVLTHTGHSTVHIFILTVDCASVMLSAINH